LILLILGGCVRLFEAANGAEAIDRAPRVSADLIIIDLELPSSGDKLIRQLKDDPSTTHIPVLSRPSS